MFFNGERVQIGFLVCLCSCNKIPETVEHLKNHRNSFLSLAEAGSQGQGVSMARSGPSSWFIAGVFFPCPNLVGGGAEISGGIFYTNTKPICRGLALMTSAPSRVPPPNAIIYKGLGFNTLMGVGTQAQTLADSVHAPRPHNYGSH